MPDNDNKRPLLWNDDLTAEDYLLRREMYGGTCKPKYVPSPETLDAVDDLVYPSSSDYEFYSDWHPVVNKHAYQEFNKPVISKELFDYSLYGLEAISEKDLDACEREYDSRKE